MCIALLVMCLPLAAQQGISETAEEAAIDDFLAQIAERNRVRTIYAQYSKEKIGEVPYDTPYTVVKRAKTWVIIQFNQPNVPGWVSRDYLTIQGGVATVQTDVLNFRLSPSAQSKILAKLYAGYTSPVLGDRNGFVRIQAPASLAVAIQSEQKSDGSIAPTQASASKVVQSNDIAATKISSKPSSEAVLASGRRQDSAWSTGVISESDKPLEKLPPKKISDKNVPTKTPAERQHKIAPGDAISLLVFGEKDLSIENMRVPQSGRVSFPLIGQVSVVGKTTAEVERIVAELLSQGYVRNPRLSVTIFSYRPIFIRGAVQNTGAFPYTEGLTIAKAIALAGGSKNSAKQQGVSVLRDGSSIAENLPIDSQYRVSSGDVISIAEEQGVSDDQSLYIYVHGEVSQPGEYVYRKGLTVEKAIVLASGFGLRASKRKITITRYAGVETQAEPVKLRRVKLFTPIEPGDVIDVGASWF